MKPRLSAGPLFLGAGEVTGEPDPFLSSEATDKWAHKQEIKQDQVLYNCGGQLSNNHGLLVRIITRPSHDS